MRGIHAWALFGTLLAMQGGTALRADEASPPAASPASAATPDFAALPSLFFKDSMVYLSRTAPLAGAVALDLELRPEQRELIFAKIEYAANAGDAPTMKVTAPLDDSPIIPLPPGPLGTVLKWFLPIPNAPARAPPPR